MISSMLRGGALVVVLSATAAFAGDTAEAEVVGFSKDGKHFAFLQKGTEDGSGAAWCELFTLVVKTNAWAKPPVSVRRQQPGGAHDPVTELSKACADAKKKAAATLKSLGLDRPVAGTQVIHHPLHDVGVKDELATFSMHRCFACGTEPVRKLTIEKSAATGDAKCKQLEANGELMTLLLDGAPLQKDTELPASRGCGFGYRIDQAFVSPTGDGLAVLVGFKRPGFEGPDYRLMGVSGALPAVAAP